LQIPGIVGDRFARLNHGYNGTACDSFTGDNSPDKNFSIANAGLWVSEIDGVSKPPECVAGADDAQDIAVWANLFFSALAAVGNPVIGSYSDNHRDGRRAVMLLCLALATLPSLVLMMLIQFKKMNPYWYYAGKKQ
jgi:MFS family permease